MKFLSATVYVILLSLIIEANNVSSESDSIRLEDIQNLTLYEDQMTTSRRELPRKQLLCVGGTANCTFILKKVQCYNRGWNGSSVDWQCKAEMDDKFAFGKLEISCEGFENAEDPYVLAGSCGLNYTINSAVKSSYHAEPYALSSGYSVELRIEGMYLAAIILITFIAAMLPYFSILVCCCWWCCTGCRGCRVQMGKSGPQQSSGPEEEMPLNRQDTP